MTRKEWIEKNLPAYVNGVICGPIRGCPAMFKDLVALDPSCNALRIGQPCCKDNGLTCTECWDQEIPGTKKTRPNGFRLEKKRNRLRNQNFL